VEPGQAGAALVLGDDHGGEAEGAGLGQDGAGDALGLPGQGVRRDAVAAEGAGGVADRRLLGGEGEVHQSSVSGGLRRFARSRSYSAREVSTTGSLSSVIFCGPSRSASLNRRSSFFSASAIFHIGG